MIIWFSVPFEAPNKANCEDPYNKNDNIFHDQICIMSYYIKWVKTSCKYSNSGWSITLGEKRYGKLISSEETSDKYAKLGILAMVLALHTMPTGY